MTHLKAFIKHVRAKHYVQIAIMFIAALAMLNNSVAVVYADSPPVDDQNAWTLTDLQSNRDGWAWFNPELNRCQIGSGTAVTATGPAADLLRQAGLDPQWVNVIVKYAAKENTDPIAMAALLFWENRGFPAYKSTGWANSGSVGSGPWQITSSTWPSSAGAYPEAADDPDTSTKVAANIVARYGGVAGYSLGAITQDFSKNSNLKTIATLAKNYNAGQASYRTPGSAAWNQSGRVWYNGVAPWATISPTKDGIIDDYVVAMTYLYYQIASGTKITYKDSNSYVKEGVANTDKIKNFAWKPTSGSGSSTAPSATNNTGGKPVIVLDPGHANPGSDKNVDPASNIAVYDYSNLPGKEMSDMWNVANKIKSQLETAGYQVYITKDNLNGTNSSGKPNTNLKQRAEVGTQYNAALGISLHTSPGTGTNQDVNFIPIAQEKDSNGKITVQGNWRLTYDGKTKKYYTNTALAETDKKMAAIFQKTRAEALGIDASKVRVGSYENIEGGTRKIDVPGGFMEGSVLVTQYFATTPWMYFEQTQDGPNNSLKSSTIEAYVKGVVDGVKLAVPSSGNASDNSSCNGGTDAGVGQGNIVKTALYYAWDTPDHGKDKSDAKPSYQRDMPKFNGATDIDPYSDCGVFVSTVMIASGADPNYPKRGTGIQEAYVQSHPDLYDQIKAKSTADLQPGDIFIVNGGGQGHTFLHTGTYTGGDGKKYNAAAASLHGHVPEAGQTYFSQGGVKFTIWRLKHS